MTPKKPASSAQMPPDRYFVNELTGETPPSFAALKSLYEVASDLFALEPWQVLDESQLIVIRDSDRGEFCYCSVMGAAGEVYSMQAYIGDEGLRTFRRIEAGEIVDPGEFYSSMRSVSVEFVPKAELERQDRELLAALGHPNRRGLASPLFRAIRPGFHPWFVTAQEAHTLAECLRAVIVVCAAVTSHKGKKFWAKNGTCPLVTRVDEAESQYGIELIKPVLAPEPPAAPASLPDAILQTVRSQDYAVRGTMELDYIFSGAPVGKKNERKACACIALALDAATGIVYAPEITDSSVPPGDALASVFLKAIQASRELPKEVRVRSEKLRDSIAPVVESFGVKARAVSQLPAADEARAGLLGFLLGGM